MKALSDCLLYAFVDSAYLDGRSPELVAQQLCDGGADLIQFRAKNSATHEILRTAEKLLAITAGARVGLVINDHPQIAVQIGARLCHLGQEDFFDAGYTHMTDVVPPGSRLRIGLSTHAPLQAERALTAGAAYLGIGPVFPTGTKPGVPAVTVEYVRWAAGHVPIPWFAIGGITLTNLESVLAAGARRVCVVSAILRAPDVVRACQEFKERLLSARRDENVPT